MANRTLYVTAEDEQAWHDAKSLSDGGPESLSKLAAEGLRLVVAQRLAQPTDTDARSAAFQEAVARFGRELRELGWERAGAAFARACMDYRAVRQAAAAKANATKGPAGRSAAANKANQTKGDAGRKAAGRKAAETKKSRQLLR